MYALKNLASRNPIQISAAIMAIVNFLIIMDWIEMSPEGVAGLNTAIVAVLGLFVVSTTTNTAKLEELAPGEEG